ncbi:MAG: hypothetical protein IOC54_08975 [Methylobacterium sp.]|nr:hypothetical protein [Methylobacterium sp.]MCA3637579.1 hypothetical protein [Methylobacterium sp.]MCA3645306.1 hypothetical protein [Methylobacterium sp.]MCA3651955.1 hypothetical protein [Methylobacterium sp.]MCA4922816.1 hypothetical protein [Methylobacterium sp.]
MHQRSLLPVIALLSCVGSVRAENFMFAPAPHQELNRIFRVDRATGEMGACNYAIKDENSVGLTLCYPAGEGAKAGEAGDYALVPSNHRAEAGIYRVNRRTGDVSVCFVRGDQEVVCTPPAR